jgi:hypothetical protein
MEHLSHFIRKCRGYNSVTWTVLRCNALQLSVYSALTTPVECSGALKTVLLVAVGFQSADSLRSKLSNAMLLLFCWLDDNVSMRSAAALATTVLKVGFVV